MVITRLNDYVSVVYKSCNQMDVSCESKHELSCRGKMDFSCRGEMDFSCKRKYVTSRKYIT